MKSITSHSSLRPFGWCVILLSLVLAAGCGGGGGGGSTSSTPAAPTYTYSTNDQLIAADTFEATAHLDSAVGFYRQSSPDGNSMTGNYCRFFGELAAIPTTEITGLVVTTTMAYKPQTFTCGSGDFSIGDSLTFSIDFDRYDSYYRDFPGVWDGHLVSGVYQVGEKNVNTLKETAFHYMLWSEHPSSNWPTTQYTDVEIAALSYADKCVYSTYRAPTSTTTLTDADELWLLFLILSGQANDVNENVEEGIETCSRIKEDTTYEEDIIASVTGSTTFPGDMPTSGTNAYRVKALMYGATLNSTPTETKPYGSDARCSDRDQNFYQGSYGYDKPRGPRFSWCDQSKNGAATGDQILTVDFSNGTVSGNIELGYLLLQASRTWLYYKPEEESDLSTMGTVSVNATISGNSFSGTFTSGTGPSWCNGFWNEAETDFTCVSYPQMNDWNGSVSGHFFGPNGKEIGGVVKMWGVEEDGSTSLVAGDTGWGVAAFAGSMN